MARDIFSASSDESIAIRAFGIVRRRKAPAAIAFATVLSAIVAFALYLPDLYQAHARVLVERPLSDAVVGQTVSGELDSRLYVIKEEILSRDRLTELVTRFDLYPNLRRGASFEDVLAQARNDIDWEPSGPEQVSGGGRTRTMAFTLAYTGADRETVDDVANAIAAFYLGHNSEMRAEAARRASAFMKEQLDAAARDLDREEQRLRAYTRANQTLLPQAVGVNLATYTRLNDDLRSIRDQQWRVIDQRERMLEAMTEATEIAAAAAPTLAAGGDTVPPSKELLELSDRLNKAKVDLQEMQRTRGVGAGHPDVITSQNIISTLEQQVAEQQKQDIAKHNAAKAAAEKAAAAAGLDPSEALPRSRRTIESLDADLARLQKDEAAIHAQIASLSERFDGAPAVQQDYLLLQRDHQGAKENYDIALRNYEQAQVAESIETGGQGERFRVLEAAVPPEGPAAPNRLRLMLMGLLLALGAAGAAVIAAEKLDTSFHTVDDLREFTAIPVLATIPRIGPLPGRSYVRMALGTVSAIAAITLVATLSAYIANGNEALVRLLQRAG
jgi:polysaccharide chain length determinant protein (PEP-CTERM system associated)